MGHIPLPARARVNSVLARGLDLAQSVSSPLAQIFQPLIVDDDFISGDDQHSSEAATSGPSGNGMGAGQISYGPATRRRLSSMHVLSPPRRGRTYSSATPALGLIPGHREGGADGAGPSLSPERGGLTVLRKFPTNSPLRSHLGLMAAQAPLSESPDERGEAVDANSGVSFNEPRETASQAEAEEENGTGEVTDRAAWEQRWEGIEARQRRMEEMLMEIASNLRAQR